MPTPAARGATSAGCAQRLRSGRCACSNRSRSNISWMFPAICGGGTYVNSNFRWTCPAIAERQLCLLQLLEEQTSAGCAQQIRRGIYTCSKLNTDLFLLDLPNHCEEAAAPFNLQPLVEYASLDVPSCYEGSTINLQVLEEQPLPDVPDFPGGYILRRGSCADESPSAHGANLRWTCPATANTFLPCLPLTERLPLDVPSKNESSTTSCCRTYPVSTICCCSRFNFRRTCPAISILLLRLSERTRLDLPSHPAATSCRRPGRGIP